jgi:ABC-type Fe3+/spermidine/putrescine transport system ATPase subunit
VKALRLEHVTVRYGAVTALDGIDLSIEPGEVLAVLGPSGSGKTTLLNAVAGFIDVADGEIWIGDTLVASAQRSLPIERRGVGVVFQSYGLWPHMNALDTVAYPLRRQRQPASQARARAKELLGRVGLAGLEHRRPGLLSGGQQQRVGLARALACHPRVFLFDEPTANLDSGLRAGLQEQIREQQQRTGAAALYVTHDPAEAFVVADRVAAIRDARLVQVASAREIYNNPADEWIARLTGPCSILSAEVLDDASLRMADAVVGSVNLHSGAAPERGEARVVVRPEWISTGPAGSLPLAAVVKTVAFAGAHAVCALDTGGGSLVVHVPGDLEVRPGDEISWAPTTACVLRRQLSPQLT